MTKYVILHDKPFIMDNTELPSYFIKRGYDGEGALILEVYK